MKFSQAMQAYEQGKPIRCLNWRETAFILNHVRTHFSLSKEDIDSEWEIFEDSSLSFSDVIEGLKEGKKYRRKLWTSGYYISCYEGSSYILSGVSTTSNLCKYGADIEDLQACDWIEIQ